MPVVLAAIDFQTMATSKAVVEKAIKLSEQMGATLHLVHVAHQITSSYTAALTLGMLRTELKELTEHNKDAAKKAMLEMAGDAVAEENCHVLIGNPVERIYELAAKQHAELLVIGNNNHRPMHVSSVSHKMIQLAGFDLYVVHHEKEDD